MAEAAAPCIRRAFGHNGWTEPLGRPRPSATASRVEPMALTGKILAALNLVMAALFLVTASADWGQRREWGYALFRHELALDGLPLDDRDRDVLANLPRVKRLGQSTLNTMFRDMGEPVRTRTNEVTLVQGRVRAAVTGESGEAGQRKLLAAVLIPLANTGSQRDDLQQKLQSADINTLLGPDGPLERVFASVLSGKDRTIKDAGGPNGVTTIDPFAWSFLDLPDEGKGNQRDPAEQRRVVTHLLFNLPPNIEPPQRVVVVVGLRAYAEEGTRQAIALGKIASGAAARIDTRLATDRAAFIQRYDRIIRDLEILRQRIDDRTGDVARITDLAVKHRLLVAGREAEVTQLLADLKQSRDVTRKALAALAGEQQLLFQAQRDVRLGLDKDGQLERELRRLEQVGSETGHSP